VRRTAGSARDRGSDLLEELKAAVVRPLAVVEDEEPRRSLGEREQEELGRSRDRVDDPRTADVDPTLAREDPGKVRD
jgi:hypothetical protein